VVVADAGSLGADLAPTLAALRRAAPGADVVVAFWNAAAASALLTALAGRPAEHATISEEEVRAVLANEGLLVAARGAWRDDATRWLADDVDRGLRQVVTQMNPAAADDGIVYTARAGAYAPRHEPLRAGLLSVVIRNHTLDRLQLLDHAVFSLACQAYRPLEIVLVTQSRDPDAVVKLTTVLERHRHVDDYAFQVVARPSAEDIRGRLLNVGVEAARGQYLAFLDDDDVVYPQHYRRLVDALQGGAAAWAVGRTRIARFTSDAEGALYCTAKHLFSHHDRFSLPELVHENYIPAHAYVLDRERLGPFRVAFSEEVSRAEDYVFLLRLASFFRPVFLGEGASCEYRMRDDGSNSNMIAEQPEEVMARELVAWRAAQSVKDAMKRGLAMLLSMGEYEDDVKRAYAVGREVGIVEGSANPVAQPLRHRIVDAMNVAAKRAVPGAHGRLKDVLARIAAGIGR
jgi:hypothetical protein